MDKNLVRHERITPFTAGCLIVFSGLIDLAQAVPLVGWLLSPLAAVAGGIILYIWYKILGINFSDSIKRFLILIGQWLIELIPILNILPAWTFGTAIMISLVKTEDALHNKGIALNLTESEKYQSKMVSQRQEVWQRERAQAMRMSEEQANDTINSDPGSDSGPESNRVPLQSISYEKTGPAATDATYKQDVHNQKKAA